jgi:hypothetical protein
VLEYGQTTSENSPLEVNMFVGVPEVKIEAPRESFGQELGCDGLMRV